MDSGRNFASKHQNQPEDGDEQADAGRGGGRTDLARPNSPQARTVTRAGKYFFPCVQLTTSRICKLTRLFHALLYIIDEMAMHKVYYTFRV